MSTPLRTASALVRTMRPRQWTKNVLVVAAALAAGVLGDGNNIAIIVGAFVAFTLAASAVYLFNDARDVEADRKHPRKKLRPVAAGELSVRTAVLVVGRGRGCRSGAGHRRSTATSASPSASTS